MIGIHLDQTINKQIFKFKSNLNKYNHLYREELFPLTNCNYIYSRIYLKLFLRSDHFENN